MIYGVVASLAFGGSLGLAIAARIDRAPGWRLQPKAGAWLMQVLVISTLMAALAAGLLFLFLRGLAGPQPMP